MAEDESVPRAPDPTMLSEGIGAEASFVPRCPHCDYILIGLTVERCPECGKRFSLAQLRTMHMRRRPTPWEDPHDRGSIVRRYFATWRAILRPPFFLFLARPGRAWGAVTFTLLTYVLVAAAWTAVLGIVLASDDGHRILYGVLGIPPPVMVTGPWGRTRGATTGPAAICLHIGAGVFVGVLGGLWYMLCRVYVAVGGGAAESRQRRATATQVVCYLSCWLGMGLVVFALGVLAMVPCDVGPPFYLDRSFLLVVVGLAELIVVAVWCCQADAAMRDGLERKSSLVGPFLVLFCTPVALLLAGLLAGAAMPALAAAL